MTGVGVGLFFGVREWNRAMMRREQAARQLAAEREHVRRTVDMVLDPSLTAEEQLLIIDGFIPRLRARGGTDPQLWQLRDRLVVVNDLTPKARTLLDRVRKAVWTIHGSRVKQLKLLDDIANDIILPREIWEIAHLLLTQSLLAKRQQEARRAVVATPEFEAVLAPQEAALRRSINATMERVVIVEEYARRVQEADAALLAQEMLGDNDQYWDLLARTDDVEGMRHLTYQAVAASEVLAKSVRDAIEVGQMLIPPESTR
ncbi:hypothetical protein [Nonomuraea turcica]|uniref:hypothetical protein n=1 Tax=Nonomuraea sp. G32 TaxID=3067274 RepID=UPI00273C2FBE|nr:hypothetical protein [Nonomuraea sp. G32]MDP4507595.1 hypothetical protein [Nonomuraea sp. G32]